MSPEKRGIPPTMAVKGPPVKGLQMLDVTFSCQIVLWFESQSPQQADVLSTWFQAVAWY